MKFSRFVSAGFLALLFSGAAEAAGTPFDNFVGSYRVLNNHCMDLVNNRESHQLALAQLRISQLEGAKAIRISHISSGATNVLRLEEDPYSAFSGDGTSSARWIRNIEYGYLMRTTHSISKIDGKTLYSLEHRYLSDGSVASPGNTHFRCDLELLISAPTHY